MTQIYTNYIKSDTVILLLDTAQGFINHQGKAFLDRTIPHYLPYIEIVDNECHHIARYESYPDLVFHFNTQGLTSAEEQAIEDYLYRTAYHFRSKAYRILENDHMHLKLLDPRPAKNRQLAFSATDPLDHLIIYNGSPRRSGSNSATVLNKIAMTLEQKVEIRDLKEESQWDSWTASFASERHVMFFMPLYVHGMPSHVMHFLEKLPPSPGSISFFIQSGFPESSQSHYLEAYLELLAQRLGRIYLGTAIKGGLEGLQGRSEKAQDKMIEPMIGTISHLVNDGRFSPADIRQLANPVRFGPAIASIIRLMGRFGLMASFWDSQLKKNEAYDRRLDQPYASKQKE
jgi:multimeric flavodoxin WrbA